MKFLFQANTVAEGSIIQLLKSTLEETGIESTIRNESLSVALGDIPFTECLPALWILNDEDYQKAEEILLNWRRSQKETHTSWVCPSCKETIEGQFTSCWKCGTEQA
jgi:hypothetical protein